MGQPNKTLGVFGLAPRCQVVRPSTRANHGSVLKVEDVFGLKVHDLKSLPSDKPLQLEGILVDPPWPAVSPEAFFPLLVKYAWAH